MIDVDNVVALVGATETLDKTQIEKERAIHAQLKIVERPTPNVEESLTEPKHEHIVIDTDSWVMDDYVELMDLQENNNLKDVLNGQRKFCMRVVKDWNFVDSNGNKIPVTEAGMGRLKPREFKEVSDYVLKLAQTSFLL